MVGSAAKKPQQWALTSRTVPSARANTRSSCASFSAMQADDRIAFASDAAVQKLAARLDAAPARSHCVVLRVPEDAVAVQMIAWHVSDPLRSRSHAIHCMTSTGAVAASARKIAPYTRNPRFINRSRPNEHRKELAFLGARRSRKWRPRPPAREGSHCASASARRDRGYVRRIAVKKAPWPQRPVPGVIDSDARGPGDSRQGRRGGRPLEPERVAAQVHRIESPIDAH